MIDIVITGGPSAGKSTAISRIVHFCRSLGHQTISMSEIATEFKVNGITPDLFDDQLIFQKLIVERTIQTEDFYLEALSLMKKDPDAHEPVLVCDRGLFDGIAYCNEQEFHRILRGVGMDPDGEFGSRYNLVIHMRSAACGAEEYYTTENNKARTETPEEARELDERTLAAWKDHPNLRIIDNSGDSFDSKINEVLRAIASVLHAPEPCVYERKYLVKKPNLDHSLLADAVDITQWYLPNGVRLRAWKKGGSTRISIQKKAIRHL